VVEAGVEMLRKRLALIPRDRSFANGRTVRNILEHALGAQAVRLLDGEPTVDDLRTLTADDLDAALDEVAADTAPGSLPGYV